jgi:hypothetical protein
MEKAASSRLLANNDVTTEFIGLFYQLLLSCYKFTLCYAAIPVLTLNKTAAPNIKNNKMVAGHVFSLGRNLRGVSLYSKGYTWGTVPYRVMFSKPLLCLRAVSTAIWDGRSLD